MNIRLIVTICLTLGLQALNAQERPNVLWITMEDISPELFSCYGNRDIETPNIDRLASEGIRFTMASSTAPHCSPARSTIITGAYATTYGMDVHREPFETPESIFYPQKLREMGYFCSNQYKTDYNTTFDHKSMWDECGKEASYNSSKRQKGQPFFAIFNTHATHMGRIRSVTTRDRPDFKSTDNIDPNSIQLPPHVPDLEEVRSDYAFHLQSALHCDRWVKSFLDDLRERDLHNDTIIFFFSDHGGVLPRGKAFPFETGLRVPFIVHVPKKWQKKLQIEVGVVDHQLIGFEDLAPTLLSLLGQTPMPHMQGRVFLGPSQQSPKKLQFGFRTNQENYHFDPCRMASDGRYKYVRNYVPHKPFHLRNLYQWGMPANQAWDREILEGRITKGNFHRPYQPKGPEMLFDLKNDPYELNNLAEDPEHQAKLKDMRDAVSKHIRSSGDLGFFLRSKRKDKVGGPYQWVKDNQYDLETLYATAERSSMPSTSDLPHFLKLLNGQDIDLKYWAAQGILNLALMEEKFKSEAMAKLKATCLIEEREISSILCEALCYQDHESFALPILVREFAQNFNLAYSCLETITWQPKHRNKLNSYISAIQAIASSAGPVNRFSVHGKARSLLVNLGALDIHELYTQQEKEIGRQINLNPREFSSVHP